MINKDLLQDIIENGNEEEQQLINLALKAIERKREKNTIYLSSFLDFTYEFPEEDCMKLTFPMSPFLLNSLGIVHGGITATIMDIAMGTLVTSSLKRKCVTTEMKINYLKPGKGKFFMAKAIFLHKGKTQCVVECKVYNEENVLIAAGTGTFFLID